MTEKLSRPDIREPIFNVPTVIIALIGSFVAVHVLREFSGREINEWIILRFAFSPGRFVVPNEFPGGQGAVVWSFFSHMFLHGSWEHLVFNSLWMLAFGSIVARRFGALRFVLFSLTAAALGAVGTLLAYWGQYSLMIGASGAISGHMAAAIRLMYSAPGGLANMQATHFNVLRVLSLRQLLQNRGALIFIGIWLIANLVFGLSGFGAGGNIGRIAWEAHLGGFLGGLFLFSLFDKKPA